MTPWIVDAGFLAVWAGLPLAALVRAHGRLRRARSSAMGPWTVVCTALGIGVIAVALLPSLDGVAERSFAAHMGQHLAIGVLGPLLLVLGRARELLPWALEPAHRREFARRTRRLLPPPRSLTAPTVATVAVWYAWHLPWLYGSAIDQPVVHLLEHATILGVGVWFWSATADARRRRLPGAVVALFLVALANGLLAATLSLSPNGFYEGHVVATSAAARLDDQHLGGLLMWVPGGLVHLLAAVVQLLRWLGADVDASAPVHAPEVVS